MVKLLMESGDKKPMAKRQVVLTDEQYNTILTALKLEILKEKENPTQALEYLEDAQNAMLNNFKLIR